MSYSDFKNSSNKSTVEKKDWPKVGYFSQLKLLKDDGDEAIVRFVYDANSASALDDVLGPVWVHKVPVEGQYGTYYRYVACARHSFEDGKDACPLCSATEATVSKLTPKLFVKMVVYTKSDAGVVVANPVVWDKHANFAGELLNKYQAAINELGLYPVGTPLSDMVFKIKRHGKAKDIHTTYELIPTNPSVYKSEFYPKEFTAFNNFKLEYHSYSEKTAEEMREYLTTKQFPMRSAQTTSTVVTTPAPQGAVVYQQTPTTSATATFTSLARAAETTTPSSTSEEDRPIRRFASF